jgi:hypothetical protein
LGTFSINSRDSLNKFNITDSEAKELAKHLNDRLLKNDLPFGEAFSFLVEYSDDRESMEKVLDGDFSLAYMTRIKIAKRYAGDRFELLKILVDLYFCSYGNDDIYNEITCLNPTEDEYKKLSEMCLKEITKNHAKNLSNELFLTLLAHSDDKDLLEKYADGAITTDEKIRIEAAKRFYTDRFELFKYYITLCFNRFVLANSEIEALNPTDDELNMLGKIYVEKMIEYPGQPITKKILDKLTDRQSLEEIWKHSHSWVHRLIAADRLSVDRKQIITIWCKNILNAHNKNVYLCELIKPDNDELFLLGQMTGDKLRKSRSSETADLLNDLINDLNLPSFEDGVFSKGDIAYTRNVQVEWAVWDWTNYVYDDHEYLKGVEVIGEDRFEDQTEYLTPDGIKRLKL